MTAPRDLRRADFTVLSEHPTRWADVDAYGHVNNVVHYALFDSAVNAWLISASGVDVRTLDAVGLVVETSCSYLAELHFPSVVTCGLRLAKRGTSSVTYELALFAPGSEGPAAVGRFVHVYVDAVTRRPVPPPAEVARALDALAGLPVPTVHPDPPPPRVQLTRDGRTWRIGDRSEVAWLQDRPRGVTVETLMPLVYEAYATVHLPDGADIAAHERAVVDVLASFAPAPWWLGYLETGAHDVVFPTAPRVGLYTGWEYVLVEAGPEQALSWRAGHMRHGSGALPDLVFPRDRSWCVNALWDDTWTCVGGPDALIDALVASPLANARRIQPGEDTVPPGLVRD